MKLTCAVLQRSLGCNARHRVVLLLLIAIFAATLRAQTRLYANVEGNFDVIDPATKSLIGSIPLPPFSGGIVITPDGRHAYVESGGGIVEIDLTTVSTVAILPPVQAYHLAITPNGSRIYVASGQDATNGFYGVIVVDTAANSVVAEIPFGDGCSIAMAPDGAKVYIGRNSDNDVLVLDTSTNTVTTRIPLGTPGGHAGPCGGAAISPDGGHVYFTHSDGNVYVISTASNAVESTIAVGVVGPAGIVFTPDGSHAYVADNGYGYISPSSVSLIDTASKSLVATIPVGLSVRLLAITPDGTRLFVGDTGFWGSSAFVFVIDTATNVVVDSIPIQDPTRHGQVNGLAITPLNTPVGTNIGVPLNGGATAPGGVSVTFSSVSTGGNTTLTTSGTGAPPPAGFKLGNPPTYYDLSTTAVFSGLVTVCINYGGTTFGNASKLRLFHFANGAWVNVTTSNDTIDMIICGNVTSFSAFAIFESTYTATIQRPINADGSSVFSAKRGVVPVKFTLALGGAPTCQLPPATISLARTAGAAPGPIDESTFAQSADTGSYFRIDSTNCQYVYNLTSSSLGPGTYLVQISLGGTAVGSGTFGLQ